MPSRVCCGGAASARVKYNSFGKPATPQRADTASSSRKPTKSVRFAECSTSSVEQENSVNERLLNDGASMTSMEPLYATVRKGNNGSPVKEQLRSVVPQVPLNIQPGMEQGFRPYNSNIRRPRHFRQNTDLGLHAYKVTTFTTFIGFRNISNNLIR